MWVNVIGYNITTGVQHLIDWFISICCLSDWYASTALSVKELLKPQSLKAHLDNTTVLTSCFLMSDLKYSFLLVPYTVCHALIRFPKWKKCFNDWHSLHCVKILIWLFIYIVIYCHKVFCSFCHVCLHPLRPLMMKPRPLLKGQKFISIKSHSLHSYEVY